MLSENALNQKIRSISDGKPDSTFSESGLGKLWPSGLAHPRPGMGAFGCGVEICGSHPWKARSFSSECGLNSKAWPMNQVGVMARYRLTIEYDGAGFSGWQRVGDGKTGVQAALEEAVFAMTGERADVIGAGRTDAGVHARGQVAHVDLAKELRPDRLRDGLCAHLRPQPVAVVAAAAAPADFHARFSARVRVYEYVIINRRADLALARGRAWRIGARLDAAAMALAARRLEGHHDFSTFRDAQCQAPSPMKTLDRCAVSAEADQISVWCEARSFLHRQVRSMVGTLVEAGLGKMTPDDVAAALAAADRTRCGPVAPAAGLYLDRVGY
jgi:tRNA pseudouridine38-40 synthase